MSRIARTSPPQCDREAAHPVAVRHVAEDDLEYDIAVSFSGEQRAYVELVVRACQERGMKVFYDADEAVRLWGTNVIPQLRRIFGGVAARYVVPFLSREYLAGPYPMDELSAAMRADVERGGGYLLPILLDDVEVPADVVDPAVIYLQAGGRTPDQLADVIVEKAGMRRQRCRAHGDGSQVVRNAAGVRLPRIAPTAFNAQATLDAALDRVGRLFRQAAGELEPFGFACTVRSSGASVEILVEERGKPVCELHLRSGGRSWRGRLVVSFGWPLTDGSVAHGFVSAVWDTDASRPVLVLDDIDRGGSGVVSKSFTNCGELFTTLWDKIVDFIERRTAWTG
ncbi:TIR domain-containing protein [Amycolatopsis sp. NPDC004378]